MAKEPEKDCGRCISDFGIHGKTKILDEKDGIVRMMFKDVLVGDGGARIETLPGKGEVGARMTAHLYSTMEKHFISTHFIKSLGSTIIQVKQLHMFPFEVVVRGVALGSFCRRYGIPKGKILPRPVVELFLKNDELNDPLINSDVAVILGCAEHQEIEIIRSMALKCWNIVSAEFERKILKLLDIKFEFGELEGKIVLGDEIGFDTLRLCDIPSGHRLDKDIWYEKQPGVHENLEEIKSRINSW